MAVGRNSGSRHLRGQTRSNFRIGDTVDVIVRVREDDGERFTLARGMTIVSRHRQGAREVFKVRGIVEGRLDEQIVSKTSLKSAQVRVRNVKGHRRWGGYGDAANSRGETDKRRLERKKRLERLSRLKQLVTPVTLEKFDGFVDHIEGDRAIVSLMSEMGEKLTGEYSASDLARIGIHERRRFLCRTVLLNGKVEVELHAIPDLEISHEVENSIDREIDELISDGELDGDY